MLKNKKLNVFLIFTVFLSIYLVACSNSEQGASEDFPTKSINLITAFAAGGSNDSIARTLAEASEDILGQKVIVENLTGGSGSIGQAAGANAKPDGYKLTLVTASIVSNPLFNDLPYSHESFEPVILINNDPQYLIVNTKSSYDNIDSFIEYAKENPGKVKIGVSGAQTTNAFASKDLSKSLDLDIVTVPHEGTADAVVALQGGHIDAVVASYTEFQGQLKSGELMPILNFAGEERSHHLPDTPTALELNIDVDYSSWRGIAAPKGTSPEVIQTLHDAFKEAIESEQFKDAMANLGFDIDYLNPEDFQQLINETYDNYVQFLD